MGLANTTIVNNTSSSSSKNSNNNNCIPAADRKDRRPVREVTATNRDRTERQEIQTHRRQSTRRPTPHHQPIWNTILVTAADQIIRHPGREILRSCVKCCWPVTANRQALHLERRAARHRVAVVATRPNSAPKIPTTCTSSRRTFTKDSRPTWSMSSSLNRAVWWRHLRRAVFQSNNNSSSSSSKFTNPAIILSRLSPLNKVCGLYRFDYLNTWHLKYYHFFP